MAEDYLNLIKNPRRRPSNSPAPEPSRGSAPFANPIIAPSTNAPYINNLDRLKSIDVQNSGNNNFQGYEPVRRDVSPHSNRFSAPITSIGERAGIPGPSLYGDVPQQPQGYKAPFIDLSSANREPTRDRSPTYGINRDISPRGRTLGVNDRPARIGTGSINSNTGLFGDTSYKGSTGDSGGITQRRGSGSQQSGPLKFSGGNRVNHDVSPKFGRKDKSPMIRKSRKKKMEIPIIVLGVLLIILIGVAAVVLLTPKPVNFCDSPLTGKTQRPNCTPCPEHGICKDGKLIACKDKFKPYKNECVEDYETAKKYGQYRSYINDHLAYLKGEKMCDPTIKDYLTLNEIQTQLKNKYGPKDRELESVKFESRWNDYFEKDEGLYIEKDMYGEDIYTTTDEGSPSLSCKFKLLWREGKLAGTWLALFIGTVVLAIKLIRLHVVYSRLGREMYDDVREYLTHFKNVSVKTLKKEFEHKHPGKSFEKIWSYVESYRKQDARIYQYYDIYQGVNQEFWLRVR